MSLATLQKKLGYTFKESDLLKNALVHSSCHETPKGIDGDNERLEFLGDRVLGLHVSDLLFKVFPDEPEGKLAKRLAVLVRQSTLVEVALEWSLGDYLYLGGGEETTGGREKPTILSNAVEAILAAIYLDGGFTQVGKVIRKFWQPFLAASDEIDPKTGLQEWVQGKGHPLPEYELVSAIGAQHECVFTMKVLAVNQQGQGQGRSKQEAQQNAARDLLNKLEKEHD